MITSLRRKVFSALAITYAFASSNAMSEDQLFNLDKEDSEISYNLTNNIENSFNVDEVVAKETTSRTQVVPMGDQSFLKIDFEDGEELYWSMEHTFSLIETNAPFGMNDKGLIVETEVNEFTNSYTNEKHDMITRIKANDFPAWILSKYSTVEELKSNIERIAVVKESNDNPLSYFISDKKETVALEIKDSKVTFV